MFVFAAPAAAATAESGTAGMPQFDASTIPSQIVWLVIAVVVLHFLLSRVVLPRIADIISTREQAISGDLDRAAELHERAEGLREEIEANTAEAHAEAQKIAAASRAEFLRVIDAEQAEADARISAAAKEGETRIQAIRETALADIDLVAREVAATLAETILKDRASQDTVDAAVSKRLQTS